MQQNLVVARRWTVADWACTAALCALAAAVCWVCSAETPRTLLSVRSLDAYFEADVGRVFSNLTDPDGRHRTSVHPLFSLVGFTLTRALGATFGLDRFDAVRLFQVLCSVLPPALLYLFGRGVGLRRADAVLLGAALCASGAFVFWCAVPETYMLGAASALLPAAFLAWLAPGAPVRTLTLVALCAASFSITVTNLAAGVLVALRSRVWKAVPMIVYHSVAATVMVWGLQYMLIPSARFPLDFMEERRYVVSQGGGLLSHALGVVTTFFSHAMVTPTPQVLERADRVLGMQVTVQQSLPPLTAAGIAALLGWGVALALGAVGAIRMFRERPVVAVLLLFLAFQLVLHLAYGEITFLYVLHWTPFLLAVAGLGLLGKYRNIARAALVVFTVCAAINNFTQLRSTMNAIATAASDRRPPNPQWPAKAYNDSSYAAKLEGVLGMREKVNADKPNDTDPDGWPRGLDRPGN
jgi:hypothetical protein